MIPILVTDPINSISVLGLISDHFVHTIEYASRLCYNSVDKMTHDSWYNYIKARVRSGHESVIEHNMISIIVEMKSEETNIKEFNELNSILNDSNTMLHYVDETTGFSIYSNKILFSLSGNIKMWRDFFKWISAKNKSSILLMTIGRVFKYFNHRNPKSLKDDVGLKDLFTFDIPFMYQMDANPLWVQIIGDRKTENFLTKSETLMDSVKVPVNTSDDEIKLEVLNIDNPSTSVAFNREINDKISPIMLSFIRKHIKDLSSITFQVTMPRIVTQQESRHRINSISQMSQRYINEGDSPKASEFYHPSIVDCEKEYNLSVGDKEIQLSYNEFNELSRKLYIALFNDGIPKETARFVLPNGICSSMVVTKPFYTLDHYFKERTSERAQYEIRIVAQALKNFILDTYSSAKYLEDYGYEKLF